MLENLFAPLKIGSIVLKNKIIMAPLTRQSAFSDGTPTKEMAVCTLDEHKVSV